MHEVSVGSFWENNLTYMLEEFILGKQSYVHARGI
jgi:hypothetical protein